MDLERRLVLTAALAAVATAGLGLPATANEISLAKTKDLMVGKARNFSVGNNKILVFRSSSLVFSVFDAVCPHDGNVLTAAMVKSARITCSKDKSVFSATSGKKLSGVSKKSLLRLKHRVANGFLVASLASTVVTPTPTQSQEILVAASRVPLGGGIRVESKYGPLVVVQPTAGEFKAFSAICTHAGCEISQFGKDEMVCVCHNSEFSTFDGAVSSGPARKALTQYPITEANGQLFVG